MTLPLKDIYNMNLTIKNIKTTFTNKTCFTGAYYQTNLYLTICMDPLGPLGIWGQVEISNLNP